MLYLRILSEIGWTLIRQVFIRAREAFALQPQQWDSQQTDIGSIMVRYSLY